MTLNFSSSWWLNHPFEKYARQIGSSPQFYGVTIKNHLKPPASYALAQGFGNPQVIQFIVMAP